ncbi:MAG: hypothetical protein AB2A00_16090 [Myxococcota bacterium]
MLRKMGCMALVVLVMGACQKADSEDIKTSGMHATITATSDGDGTHVQAVLRVGGAASNTIVRLSSGDKLTATAGDETAVLSETQILSYTSYATEMQSDADGQLFVVALERASEEDKDALENKATLPNGFTVSAPVANAIIKRSQQLVIDWAPSGTSDEMDIVVDGDCVRVETFDVSGDPGTFTINAGTIKAHNDRENESCNGTIVVKRTRAGTLDPAFGSGVVTGVQARTINVRIDP